MGFLYYSAESNGLDFLHPPRNFSYVRGPLLFSVSPIILEIPNADYFGPEIIHSGTKGCTSYVDMHPFYTTVHVFK